MRTRTRVLISLLVGMIVAAGGITYAVMDARAEQHKRDQERARVTAQVAHMKRQYNSKVASWEHEHDEWTRRRDEYEECKTTTEASFNALDEIDGKLDGGVNYDEYSDLVGDVSSAVGTAVRSNDILDCFEVTQNLAKASDQYSRAANIWLEWKQDIYDERDIEDLPTDKHWSKASDLIFDADTALDAMKDYGDELTKPSPPDYPMIPERN